eukprot:Em0003g128a
MFAADQSEIITEERRQFTVNTSQILSNKLRWQKSRALCTLKDVLLTCTNEVRFINQIYSVEIMFCCSLLFDWLSWQSKAIWDHVAGSTRCGE